MVARSKKIKDSARGQECSLRLPGCSFDTEQTIFAHVGSDRGMGFKCGDNMGVYACLPCHNSIDGHLRKTFANDILRALEETQSKLIQQELLVVK